MTVGVTGLPSPDPLMAEAKRRARKRQVLVAGLLALIAGGVVAGLFGSRSPGGPNAASSVAAGTASKGLGLVEAKGTAFPLRTLVLTLRSGRRLTVSDVKVTENGGSVVDPILVPASKASEDRMLSTKVYLLQYRSLAGPDKTIRVRVKVEGAGTAVLGYTSPALRWLRVAPSG
jgi:hypothetical protein